MPDVNNHGISENNYNLTAILRVMRQGIDNYRLTNVASYWLL
jgi:hypothetical protein